MEEQVSRVRALAAEEVAAMERQMLLAQDEFRNRTTDNSSRLKQVRACHRVGHCLK